MKYVNANKVLPDSLVREIRYYIEGIYIFHKINQKEKNGEAIQKR